MSNHTTVVTTDQNPATPHTFVDLSKNMELELEKRRHDWEQEVGKMQQDFFKMNTNDKKTAAPRSGSTKRVELVADANAPRRGGSGTEIFDISHAKTLYSENPDGSKMYKLRFDVKGYEPNEICIKAEGSKLSVTAQTKEEYGGGSQAVKQFNRQVDIPPSVDPDQLVSFLSADGILSVEAPVDDTADDEEEGQQEYHDQAYIPIEAQAYNAKMLVPPQIEPPQYHNVVIGGSSPTGYSYSSKRTSGGTSPIGYSYSSTRTGNTSPILYQSRSNSSPVADTGISYKVTRVHSGPPPTFHSSGPRRPLQVNHKKPKNSKHVTYQHTASPRTTVVEYGTRPVGISNISTTTSFGSMGQSGIEQFRYNEPTILESEEGRRMKMVVDIGKDYSPEEVNVTIQGRKIEVLARHEETISGRTSKREFAREFFSPEDIAASTAHVKLAKDGKLYIGACVKGNSDQLLVEQMVICDMPPNGKACNLSLD